MAKYKATVIITGEIEVEFEEEDMKGYYPENGRPDSFSAKNAVYYNLDKTDLNLMENIDSNVLFVYDSNGEEVEELTP